MIRDLTSLSERKFDVLVVGGGIHGVLCAWDAALRGLDVALIERGDFGSATSQNSLKTIHGGLRYLKDGNIRRIRSMANERRMWMRIAPHLVHPLTCVTPTYRSLTEGRYVMSAALGLNDLISYDRNRLPDPAKHLPGGYLLSPQDLAQKIQGLDLEGITGAAVWHDAQVYNTERLLLSFVISSVQAGAVVANYVEAYALTKTDAKVSGAMARDLLTGDEFEIKSRIVINASGAWIDQLLGTLGQTRAWQNFHPSVAINLVTKKLWGDIASGLRSDPRKRADSSSRAHPSQMFFISPWREYSLIGTWHIAWPHPADMFTLTEEVLIDFINEVNTCHNRLKLSLDDILHVHWGFLPVIENINHNDNIKLVREGFILDHRQDYHVDGLISVLGVKYTTARRIAQQAIDLAVKKLGKQVLPCRTHIEPVWGGRIDRFHDLLKKVVQEKPLGLSQDLIQHLVYTYGSEYSTILTYMQDDPHLKSRILEGLPVTKAEVVHAIRAEMAQSLSDIVQRRTELGSAGLPAREVLCTCAVLLAKEKGWKEENVEKSMQEVRSSYPLSKIVGNEYAYAS
jgi:glycerol-3-phosphate dehydrogenase